MILLNLNITFIRNWWSERSVEMNRKLIFPLALLFILVLAAPASAAIQLNVNGRTYDAANNLNTQEGIASAPLVVLSRTLGCTVTQEGNSITVQENQNCLKMTVGSTTAWLNNQEQQMPQAPQLINGQIYVPLSFVYRSLGATVTWDEAQQTISVSYPETRDGMTAEELLAKAAQKMVDAQRYKMALDMALSMAVTTAETGNVAQNVKMQLDTKSWVQANPMLMYMKLDSTVTAPEGTTSGLQNVPTEMFFNNSGMYMNIPPYGWVKMDMSDVNMQELMKQSNILDPTAILQQMKDLGMSISLANDQERNGQKYWVINAAMGGDVLNSDYFKQISNSLAIPQTGDIPPIFGGLNYDLGYSIFINQNTLCTDLMDLQAKLTMNIGNADTTNPAHIALNIGLNCSYSLSDFGVVFVVPDVSKAVDYNTVIKQ
jgi:hypothetical protein